nr:hypothetical protein [Tanacetum cinerariifolium]
TTTNIISASTHNTTATTYITIATIHITFAAAVEPLPPPLEPLPPLDEGVCRDDIGGGMSGGRGTRGVLEEKEVVAGEQKVVVEDQEVVAKEDHDKFPAEDESVDVDTFNITKASDVSLCGVDYMISGLEKGRYGVSKVFDTAYWGFLGVGTTFDIFKNILFPYGLNTACWSFLDAAYWILFPSWFLVKCRHGYVVSSLMDTAYWLSE